MVKTVASKQKGRTRILRLALVTVVGTLIIFYVALCIYYTHVFTTSPGRALGADLPTNIGLPYEEIAFPSSNNANIKLRGWFIPNAKSQRAIILVHGQNSNRTQMLQVAKPLWENGYNLLLFDLQGHGASDGEFYTFGQNEQLGVVGAADYLKGRGFKSESIGALGWSLGAVSALMAFGQSQDIKAVVSDSAYGDFGRMMKERFTQQTHLPAIFVGGILLSGSIFRGMDVNKIKPEDAVKNTNGRRVLLIQGVEDQTVSVSEAYKIIEAGGPNLESWILPGIGHVDAFWQYQAEYISRITTFFNRELV